MSRNSEQDTESNGRPSAKDKMSVPANKVGKIIGRRGAMIRELQDKSGATIDVTDELEEGKTVIRLSGTLETIKKAKMLISRIYQDEPGAGGPKPRSFESRENVIEIWVPESKCGMIIGRRGSKISEIQSQTGTRVDLNSRERNENGMCLVTISGEKDSCEEAKAIVEGIVNRVSQGFPRSDNEPSFRDTYKSDSTGGYGLYK